MFLHPAVLTSCTELWVSHVGAVSNSADDSGTTVFVFFPILFSDTKCTSLSTGRSSQL